jgi:hypothetical protein
MNETTARLIEELAAKLGTTVDQLWGVLLRQAPIAATVNIVVFLAWAFFLAAVWRKVRGIGDEDIRFIVGCIMLVLAFLTLLVVGCELSNVVSGLVNPEYWAVRELARMLRQ